MPIPPGTIPDAPDSIQPDVAYGAQQNLSRIKAGADVPSNSPLAQQDDTRGYWHSLLNAIPMPGGGSIPTNSSEAAAMLPHQLIPGYGTVQQISSLAHDPSFQNFNRNLNPLASPMEQMGSGNVAGGLGSATPFLAMSLAAPFVPKGPAGIQPGSAPAVNMISPRPSSPGPATEPVYGEPTTLPPTLLSRVGEHIVRKLATKIPVKGLSVSDGLKGTIAKPRLGEPEVVGYTPKPRVAVGPPDFAPFEDRPPMPQKPPTSNPIGTSWAGQPSQPPVPLNQAAMDAYGSNPFAVNRAAIYNNTNLSPGPEVPVPEFSQQAIAYLQNLLGNNKKALPPIPPADWKLGTPTSQGGFGRGSRAVKK